MPYKQTVERARKAKREGKAPTTQAGEFVREEMDKMKRGGRRAPRSPEQAIAIGLSQARREGVNVPERGRKTRKTTRKATSRKATRKSAARKATTPKASSRTTREATRTTGSRKASARKATSRKRTSAKRSSR